VDLPTQNDVFCQDCGKTFAKKNNLLAHRKAFHSGIAPIHVCDICYKEFRFKSNLTAHIKVHSGQPKIYNCDQCDSAFTSLKSLAHHLATHDTEKNYVCEICGKGFNTAINLRNHKKCHDEEKPRKYLCEICSLSFKRKGHVFQHQKSVHGFCPLQNSIYMCQSCPATFSSQKNLDLHFRKHTGELPFLCNHCWRPFATSVALKVHQSLAACDTKTMKCPTCRVSFEPGSEPCVHIKEKGFSTIRKVRYKVDKIPRKDRPKNFKCDICEKLFLFACDLKQHIRVAHTDERPYICDFCGGTFKTRCAMNTHKLLHSDIKPYFCNHCPKSFRRTEQLKLHLRTHTGEKPHLCGVCGKGFAQLGDCKKHMKIHNR